ncbi:hypothetical protein A1O7_07607 [Cladophialophora yegresii CBS 114405]|uniref:H/ACA ribonucleoprotein complex non-core subunit NAF1 n=1 Tax=Cladophialophora yegresii CBS 114405 TaxID=1182544 RepID=W9VX23_9EURO|nr:uncharacterized protein A1O7_07607 [Cladophialophora yegresii CBS 114405]EXJ57260.1 hypothetical protein A1O7_07607 [Cladophialophora yegresii CBS 114405]
MDAGDFPTSPAKRQRTASPEATETDVHRPESLTAVNGALGPQPKPPGQAHEQESEPVGTVQSRETQPQVVALEEAPSNSLLDVLMQQVEAEFSSNPPAHIQDPEPVSHVGASTEDKDGGSVSNDGDGLTNATEEMATNVVHNTAEPMDLTDGIPSATTGQVIPGISPSVSGMGAAIDAPLPDHNTMDAIRPEPAAVPEEAEGAEWEIDSSPYESSSDSDTSSDDSSSEEDSDNGADGDYAMLDPEEAARILMQADGGSDDEEGPRKKEGGPLRTANERMEEVIPKPDVVVTEDMKIEELGNVEFVVESTVVIKAKTSGEYRVLEAGSLICLKDRSVVGVVADLIGRVEEPRYTIRFNNDDAIKEADLWESGTTVYYVPDHSTFVFTLPLKTIKGSDASNFHDEEVGDDEMEFSDDEAEAEHKRQMKAKRQGRSLENTGRGGRGGPKFARGAHRGGGGGRGGHYAGNGSSSADGSAYGSGSLEMNYDDVSMPSTTEDGYTPLQRPADLTDMIARGEQQPERGVPHSLPPPPPPSQFRGSGDFGGRGRGYGRGGRGGFRPGRGRGGFSQPRDNHFNQHNASAHQQNGFPPQHGYPHQKPFTAPPVPNINVPTTPSITPQNITYPPMTPSPITPLPNVSFNFGRGFPAASTFPSFPPPPPGMPGFPPPPPYQHNFNFQQQQQQQQHQHQHPPQPSFAANSTAGDGQNTFLSGAWANNPAVAAALQRQIEEQRRNHG